MQLMYFLLQKLICNINFKEYRLNKTHARTPGGDSSTAGN